VDLFRIDLLVVFSRNRKAARYIGIKVQGLQRRVQCAFKQSVDALFAEPFTFFGTEVLLYEAEHFLEHETCDFFSRSKEAQEKRSCLYGRAKPMQS